MWYYRPKILDLSNWSLGDWEIKLIHNLGLMFIMNNVLPKYMRFTGARRHRNDMGMKKVYLTKNYVRLFLHILGGVGVFFTGGFYLQNEEFFQNIFSLQSLKIYFIFFDLLHQITIWLMLRNHDGIFILRSNNLSLALQKVAMDIALWEAQSFDEARPIITGLFLATAGFALTRFWCFIVAMAQVIYGRDFDSLRENWYSIGEWLAQFIIMVRMGVIRENNLPFLICVFWFPHELWTAKNDYQDIAKYVGYPPAAMYFYGLVADVTQRSWLLQTSDLVAQLALAFFSMYYCGKYFKREPLAGVDYKKHRKSMRTLVQRTITEARKSIFLYGKAQTARPSRIQVLKKELDLKTSIRSVTSSNGTPKAKRIFSLSPTGMKTKTSSVFSEELPNPAKSPPKVIIEEDNSTPPLPQETKSCLKSRKMDSLTVMGATKSIGSSLKVIGSMNSWNSATSGISESWEDPDACEMPQLSVKFGQTLVAGTSATI
jgi:hypothetical protein